MFKIESKDGMARAGTLVLPSGKKLQTPYFMPVMTKGAAKNLTPEMLAEAGTQCCIANSFVLTLKPGVEFVKMVGGLHAFSHWNGGFFTDSGGFQMLSKSLFKRIDNEKVTFKNPFDGQEYTLTPEQAMKNQFDIGADVAMALDHVPSFYGMTEEKMQDCCRRTYYWANRCKLAHDALQKDGKKQLLFGIAQGGIYSHIRKESSAQISSIGFDGIAFGGFCFGEKDTDMFAGISAAKSGVPEKYPIYVMGMGHPVQILESIGLGCDIFDSTFPTMSGRNGTVFTRKGSFNLSRAEYFKDNSPIEEGCGCYTCKHYSRAYVRHLLELKEGLGKTLGAIHNLFFIHNLLTEARKAIAAGNFSEFKEKFVADYGKKDTNVFEYE